MLQVEHSGQACPYDLTTLGTWLTPQLPCLSKGRVIAAAWQVISDKRQYG